MLTDTILRYLESNRRLVIPQLGAFVVKDPGVSILFSELLRRDDGVLRSLLCKEGMTELEAAGAIDRFVFEVRHAVQERRRYPMAGFGELYAAADGGLHFDYAPHSGVQPSVDKPQPQSAIHGTEATLVQPARAHQPVETEPVRGGASISADVHSPRKQHEEEAHKSKKQAITIDEAADGSSESPQHSEVAEVDAATSRKRVLNVPSGTVAESKSPMSKLRSDPSVKGLRYGKPVKTTDAYTYVGAAPRRRFDRLIIVAIAAAVIALAAITYGYIRGRQAARADAWAEEWIDESMLPADSCAEKMLEEVLPAENEEIQNP